jgi:hypothetical protein
MCAKLVLNAAGNKGPLPDPALVRPEMPYFEMLPTAP